MAQRRLYLTSLLAISLMGEMTNEKVINAFVYEHIVIVHESWDFMMNGPNYAMQ